jgi:hypothetical protein
MYPVESDVSSAALKIAANIPMYSSARPIVPTVTATGSAICDRCSGAMARGFKISAAPVMITSDRAPPNGNPR